ncbi:transcriptional regulator [Acinetobacter phage vB_AbaP_Alexa]|nr:transcriptional regulator [Acinetobacter phage vB_AbaP_Alexa]
MLELASIAAFDDARFGRNIDDIIILLGAGIGEYEGKPMTPSKLAEYIGMPRPTVIRRVSSLMDQGLLKMNDKKQLIYTEKLESGANKVMPKLKMSNVLRNVSFLSKMDTYPIATKKRQ